MKRLLTISACLVLTVALFASCSGGGVPPSSPAPMAPAASDTAPPPQAGGLPSNDFAQDGSGADENYFALPLLSPEDTDRRLVYAVTLHLQTTDFMPGMRILLSTVAEMGGEVTRLDVYGHDMRRPNTERNLEFSFRVPSDRLAEFIVVMENNFNIWRLHQGEEDITARYQWTDTQLGNLLEQEQRLREALEEAEDLQDQFVFEEGLAMIQREINEHLAVQGVMDDNVQFSMVDGQLYEAFLPEGEQPPRPFHQRLEQTVSGSVNTFVAFAQGLLLAVIALLPVLLILAILAVIVILVIRLFNRHARKWKRLIGKGEKKDE